MREKHYLEHIWKDLDGFSALCHEYHLSSDSFSKNSRHPQLGDETQTFSVILQELMYEFKS